MKNRRQPHLRVRAKMRVVQGPQDRVLKKAIVNKEMNRLLFLPVEKMANNSNRKKSRKVRKEQMGIYLQMLYKACMTQIRRK